MTNSIKVRILCSVIVMLSLVQICDSQSNLAFGEWESHLPYQRALSITQSPNKVYFGTDWAIMSVDKEDFSLEFISKVNGLSSIGISGVKYDEGSGNLLVSYSGDSNIDIITPEGVINVADIKNNLGIIGDKTINDVHFYEKMAYISTGFGVVSYDMERMEFGFTAQMGLKAFSTTTDDGGILYAATEDGVYSLDLNRSFNFSDFANWELLGPERGLPLIYEAQDIDFYNGSLYFISDNSVLKDVDGTMEVIKKAEAGEDIWLLSSDGPELMIGSRFANRFQSFVTFIDKDQNQTTVGGCTNFIIDVITDESGRIWYADEWDGFKYNNSKDDGCLSISTNSPFSHTVSELKVKKGILYAASGGVTDGYNFQANRNGVYVLDQGQWNNYREKNTDLFKNEDVLNIFTLATHPIDDRVFLGSFYAGVVEADFAARTYNLLNSENSPIKGSEGLPDLEKVAGMAFDNNNTLWITLYEGEKPLVAITAEGTFHSFTVNSSNRLAQITIDDSNNKWIQVVNGGILVYNDADNPADPSMHQQKLINTSNSDLRTNAVNCITKDLDGQMWVGTTQGPIIFSCGSFGSATENECVGIIKPVVEDGIPALLLITEDVRCIEVDGGDRKWIGTRNGIFVQSPLGTDKIARFTTENSPLFNDNVIDLEFDPESGIMYIATDRGIQAYKTTTTGGGQLHKINAYAYPNPVRPDYEGLIAFKGLPRDATIKVTDIQGQLVHESTALGGQATWDGLDYNGRKVASGVYLIFSNSSGSVTLDPDTAVTKVLIVR